MFHGTVVAGSESSRERKFQGTKVPPYGTFVPGSESSLKRKFLLPTFVGGVSTASLIISLVKLRSELYLVRLVNG